MSSGSRGPSRCSLRLVPAAVSTRPPRTNPRPLLKATVAGRDSAVTPPKHASVRAAGDGSERAKVAPKQALAEAFSAV